LAARAASLSLADPVVDGRLRKVGGVCVFLGEDRGCRLHTSFGAEAKPAVCRQYPLVLIRTEAGALRVGLDPGCLSTWRVWREAPEVELDRMVVSRVELTAAQARAEETLLSMCDAPGANMGSLLGALTGAPGRFPAAVMARWVRHLQGLDLAGILARPGTAPVFRDHLAPLACGDLDPEALPAWPALTERQDALALEVARRLLFLRLVAALDPPAVALFALAGAATLAWIDPAPQVFGSRLAAWSRALRSETLQQALLPGPEALRRLVEG